MSQKAVRYTGTLEDGKLVEIAEVPIPEPSVDELLIKSVAFAANPTDFKHIFANWGEKGNLVGSDASGIVVKVGANVEGFKVGDHVSAYAHGNYKYEADAGLFKEYSVADPYLTFKYPNKLKELPADADNVPEGPINSFEGAAAINLSIFTVAQTLVHNFKLEADKAANADKTILVWGGATAAGQLAIQLAKHVYGLKVVTTASKKNESLLKSFGADAVFDYHNEDVVSQVRKYAGDSLVYGFDTVSIEETWNSVNDSLSGTKPAFADNLLFLQPSILKNEKTNVTYSATIVYIARGAEQNLGGLVLPSSPEIVADHIKFYNLVAPLVANGSIKHQPLKVLHEGLNSAQTALSLLLNNKVSAQKLVFRASETK